VVPNSAESGVSVTIYGTGFQSGATVTFGGVPAEVLSVDRGWIVVKTPNRAPGPVNVIVTNMNGETATFGGFTLAPTAPFTVTDVWPKTGYGAFTFVIWGTGLSQGTTVTFGGVLPPVLFSDSAAADRLLGLLPPHDPGPVEITVTRGGRSVTMPNAFTYMPAPVLTASPLTVAAGGSVSVSWVADPVGPVDYIELSPGSASVVSSQLVPGKQGTMTFTAPPVAGRYQFLYAPFEGQWGGIAARSNVVTVTPASPAPAFDVVGILGCRMGAIRPCPMIPSAVSPLPRQRPNRLISSRPST
jgi:hypothetical protein